VDRTTFESAGRKFVRVGSQFGLTVSIPKIKGLAVGAVSKGDVSPVEVESGIVEMVKDLLTWAQICQVIVKQNVRSSVGFPKLLRLLVLCEYQYFLIFIYLSALREPFIMLWSFPSCCMVLRHGN